MQDEAGGPLVDDLMRDGAVGRTGRCTAWCSVILGQYRTDMSGVQGSRLKERDWTGRNRQDEQAVHLAVLTDRLLGADENVCDVLQGKGRRKLENDEVDLAGLWQGPEEAL